MTKGESGNKIRFTKDNHEEYTSAVDIYRTWYNSGIKVTDDDVAAFKTLWARNLWNEIPGSRSPPGYSDEAIKEELKRCANQFDVATLIITTKLKYKFKNPKTGSISSPTPTSALYWWMKKRQMYPIILDKNDTNISFDWNNIKDIYKSYGTDLNTNIYKKCSKYFYTKQYYRYYKIVFKPNNAAGNIKANLQLDLIDNRNECLFSVGSHKSLSSDNYLKGLFIERTSQPSIALKFKEEYLGISPFKNKFKSYQKKLGIKQNLLNFINSNQFVVNFDDLATLSLLKR